MSKDNYRIYHHPTGQSALTSAYSPQEACQKIGWAFGDCHVTNMTPPPEMSKEKAIEILELNLKEAGKQMPTDCRDAITLAIKSLKGEL